MFNFFKRKSGKGDAGTNENARRQPSDNTAQSHSVGDRAPRLANDVTNEKPYARKDVVNLLMPQTNYNQKTGISGLLDMMAGKRKRNKKNIERADSFRETPPRESQNIVLQRSKSDLEAKRQNNAISTDDVTSAAAKNTEDAARAADDPADFVKALVLQKYTKQPIETKQQHVSRVYAPNGRDLNDKRHAELLLREIARSIDYTIDEIKVNKEQMGTTDSKTDNKPQNEPVYETIPDNNNSIDSYKSDLRDELKKLLHKENDTDIDDKNNVTVVGSTESLIKKKSNLKPPRSDTEGGSDDDRSDCGKKRVTFRKHIVFDDGDQQTDDEVDSSFETISSSSSEDSEEGEEYLEDALPDNDELLGGVVVKTNENNNSIVVPHETGLNESVNIKIECVDDSLKRISSDNSDSGFIEISDKIESRDETSVVKSSDLGENSESEVSESEEVEEEEIEEEVEEEVEEEIVEEIEEETIEQFREPERNDTVNNLKSLVTQESKFQSQVAALTELADSRCGEAERTRELIAACRKQIEEKDQDIERLKSDLAAAYKESELVRQRSRSLEEELAAARSCSADLAEQLHRRNDESLRQLRSELDDALTRRAELESRVLALERDRDRLEQEKQLEAQKAQEAITAAEANTTKWRTAHEAARSQAAARAELMLADCEWKMRELEKRARDAEKQNKELTQTVEKLKTAPPSASHIAELQQLRGLASEQQRSVHSLTLQLQRVETREETLKLEVHRLKELLDKETKAGKEKEEMHLQTVERMEQEHSAAMETLKTTNAAAAATTRANLERAHAERTRAALAQLRAEAEQDAKNADRKLREVTTRFDNLKEVLASKESQFEHAIAEAHSKADWDIMQLRHLLDKSDIAYANNIEKMNERFEKEQERLIEEWTAKVEEVEKQAATAADEARKLLEQTRTRLTVEKNDQINKLKDQHRRAMDEQWENFMFDKETCLERMKAECRQEGEEERVKREKDLLEEIAELKSLIHSKSLDFDNLAVKAAACGRTLAVTEQELREALAREKELREKRSDDATKMKQADRASKDQIEHLTRKCACIRKLFDDMRARLTAREHSAEQESRAKDKEITQLRTEIARLTKILVEQSTPKLGTRTRADGCETQLADDVSKATPRATHDCEAPTITRRKGGSLKTPEAMRRRFNLPELQPLPPESRRLASDEEGGRKRARSVDLPAVQVPVRIKQLEEKLDN